MKKAIAIFISGLFLLVLGSCAGQQTKETALLIQQQKDEEILNWYNSHVTMATSGKWDTVYFSARLKKTVQRLRPDLDDWLDFSNEMITASALMKQGQISLEIWNRKLKDMFALLMQEEQRRRPVLEPQMTLKDYEEAEHNLSRSSLFLDYFDTLEHLKHMQIWAGRCTIIDSGLMCTNLKR